MTDLVPTAPPPSVVRLAAGWAVLAQYLDWAIKLFGAPSAIAGGRVCYDPTRALLLEWLRGLEAFVRHLLALEAAELAPPPPAPERKSASKRVSAGHGRGGFANEDSSKWSVSFALLTASRTAASETETYDSDRRWPGSRFFTSYALAERLEALIRIAENPAPYAARMARRLYAAPARIGRVLYAPASAQTPCRAETELLAQLAQDAWPPNVDSS